MNTTTTSDTLRPTKNTSNPFASLAIVNGKRSESWKANEQWLDQPLRWKKPRKIFVCAHGDLFHESVPDEWIDKVFAVMALAPQHTFQVLTKRPERARKYLQNPIGGTMRRDWIMAAIGKQTDSQRFKAFDWPLPNVWLGTSISDQASADLRIPELLACPAAVRFLSVEPMLGAVDLTRITECDYAELENAKPGDIISGWEIDALRGDASDQINGSLTGEYRKTYGTAKINWVICGGESGPKARAMHADWARSLRDQCFAAGVPFFFKQWGENGLNGHRVGKRAAGRLLDGREWNEMPKATA